MEENKSYQNKNCQNKSCQNKSYQSKVIRLKELMENDTKQDIAIAFSGGVDSSLLLRVACEYAKKNHTEVYAYTIHTMLHPMGELELTKRLAKEEGAIHKVIQVNELTEADITYNPENRCYLCKKCMFQKLKKDAEENGITTILEGTNLDDTKVYRPGIAAIKELGIKSPLLLAEFTKEEVRKLAGQYGISAAQKPSAPCMATRFPYGTRLDSEELKRADMLEERIRALGFYNVRARIYGTLVRIEVDGEDLNKLLTMRDEIITMTKHLGYDYVTVDLEGFRSGSQDIHIRKE